MFGLRFAVAGFACVAILAALPIQAAAQENATAFDGKYFAGEGDAEFLQLLDFSRRVMETDPEYQSLSMLYMPLWNGFVEGPTWDAWWIQNSYGPTFCLTPFLEEPYRTFIMNSHDLWFSQMGDGKRTGAFDWVAPDGCLCDAARPGWIVYRQGDGDTGIHDWGMEFTAAGLLMQAEVLLATRDKAAIEKYIPMLERCAAFIETRRDPEKNLFLAGAAGNLLAPSYAGYKKPDGTYGHAYLTGLSVTYIAALDRVIEVEKLAKRDKEAKKFQALRDSARKGLDLLKTDEGYFVKYMDPDGVKHGVYGAEKHGYFEAVCNHDAMALRVVDDAQAKTIYDKIASIPELRPHGLIITNAPGLDDMYRKPDDWLWKFGTWVNGGHWTTCEARMLMGYYRVGAYDDVRKAMNKILGYYKAFRIDNPLVEFGDKVYQPKIPVNTVYDTFGAPLGMLRGLFEYVYSADSVTLIPHIPPTITRLEQKFPASFGEKQLFIATYGSGPISKVWVNGEAIKQNDPARVALPYATLPARANIVIAMGDASPDPAAFAPEYASSVPETPAGFWDIDQLYPKAGSNALPLRIGADSEGKSNFAGDIQRIRIFNRALTPADVEALFKGENPLQPADTALVSDWTFDKRNGVNVSNAVAGAPSAKLVGKANIMGGARGKAMRLDGKAYLEVMPDPRLSVEKSLTVDAWIAPEAMGETGGRVVNKVTAGKQDGFLFDTYPGNSLRLITPLGEISFEANLPEAEWVHVAATCAPTGEMKLFINGKEVATREGKGTVLDSSATWVSIFHRRMNEMSLENTYEARHARLIMECAATTRVRKQAQTEGRLAPLAQPESQIAADQLYVDTVMKLTTGLRQTLESYAESKDPQQKKIYAIYKEIPR